MAANSQNLSSAIKTLYEKRLLTRALPRLIHGRHGTPARFKGFGSYEVRRWESFSIVTGTLAEGNNPNELGAPTITVTTLTPSWYGSYISYTDQLVLTSFDPAVSEMVSLLGEQAGLSLDTIIRNALTDAATKDYSGGATSRVTLDLSNDIIAFVDLIQNVAALEAQNALPVEGPFYVIIMHPYTWATLMQDSVFVTLFTREGGEALRTGFIGTILNCKIYISSNVRSYVDGGQNSTEDVYEMLFIGKEAYYTAGLTGLVPDFMVDASASVVRGGMTGKSVKPVEIIMKDLGETGFDPMNRRGTLAWKTTHTQAVTNSNWIRSLEHVNDFS